MWEGAKCAEGGKVGGTIVTMMIAYLIHLVRLAACRRDVT
jgi:hypothetical protein